MTGIGRDQGFNTATGQTSITAISPDNVLKAIDLEIYHSGSTMANLEQN